MASSKSVIYQQSQSDDFLIGRKALCFLAFSNKLLVIEFVKKPFEKYHKMKWLVLDYFR